MQLSCPLCLLLLFVHTAHGQCELTIHHPTPNAILAGTSIDFNLTVFTSQDPVDLSVSFNASHDLLLIRSSITATTLRFVLHNIPMGHHHVNFFCSSSLVSTRDFLTLPSPQSPNPWWQGYTNWNPEYVSTIASLLEGVRPLPLSLEKHPDFIGTRFVPPQQQPKTLVAMFGSRSSQVFVDRNMRRFPESEFTVMLFIYDDSEWLHFPWFRRVVSVRAFGQMKWWFIKRFLTPVVVQEEGTYDYVLLLDSDVTLPACEPAAFIRALRDFGVLIGQPAHVEDSQTTHQLLFRNLSLVGEWTNFVESGPVLAFSTKVWQCVWDLLQNDLVVGFGYDMSWGPLCAPGKTAVIHSQAIRHENVKEASSRENWMAASVAEALVFFHRTSAVGKGPESPRVLAPFPTDNQCQANEAQH